MAVMPKAQRSVDSLCFLIHQRLRLCNTRRTPNLSQRLADSGNRELSVPNGLSLYLFHEREAARTGLDGRQRQPIRNGRPDGCDIFPIEFESDGCLDLRNVPDDAVITIRIDLRGVWLVVRHFCALPLPEKALSR